MNPENTDLSDALSIGGFSSSDPSGVPDPTGGLESRVISGAVHGDDTFAVPGATGCGPNDSLNGAVDAVAGVALASGSDHSVLEEASSALAAPINGENGKTFANYWHGAFDRPGPPPRPRVGPLRTGRALQPLLALLAAACLAAGCGSSGKHGPSSTARTTAASTVGSVANRPTSTQADRSPTTKSTHTAPVSRPKERNGGAPAAVVRNNQAVRARQAAAVARIEKACSSPSGARTQSVACQLLAEARHNKALAGLLGVGAPSH